MACDASSVKRVSSSRESVQLVLDLDLRTRGPVLCDLTGLTSDNTGFTMTHRIVSSVSPSQNGCRHRRRTP